MSVLGPVLNFSVFVRMFVCCFGSFLPGLCLPPMTEPQTVPGQREGGLPQRPKAVIFSSFLCVSTKNVHQADTYSFFPGTTFNLQMKIFNKLDKYLPGQVDDSL